MVELIARLNEHVGAYGIGRYCGLEHLDDGEKVLEVREAPAAHLLMNAYRHLEMATLDPELLREKLSLEQIWVREAIEGGGLPTCGKPLTTITPHTSAVTGVVKYVLRDGAADVCAIRAARPRYLTDRDSWEKQAARVRGARSLRELRDVAPNNAAPHTRNAVRENWKTLDRPRPARGFQAIHPDGGPTDHDSGTARSSSPEHLKLAIRGREDCIGIRRAFAIDQNFGVPQHARSDDAVFRMRDMNTIVSLEQGLSYPADVAIACQIEIFVVVGTSVPGIPLTGACPPISAYGVAVNFVTPTSDDSPCAPVRTDDLRDRLQHARSCVRL